MKQLQPTFLSLLQVTLLVLPWINPLTIEPAPGVVTSLISVCAFSFTLALFLAFARTDVKPMVTQYRAILNAWLLAALINVSISLFQYFGYAASPAPWLKPWISFAHLGEAYGNLRQRNQFATLANMGLASLLWMQSPLPPGRASAKSHKHTSVLFQNIVLVLAAILAVGNAVSGSRTGLLELVCLGGLALAWRNKKLPWAQTVQCQMLVVAACAYFLAALGLPLLIGLDPGGTGILGRLQDAQASCQSRRVLWDNVLHLITQKPWSGWGWGELDYAHFVTLYPGQRFCDILDNAHNLPLHLAVELGVPFALLICGAALWLVIRQTPWREAHPARQLAWSVLALIALHSMLEYPLWYGPFQISVLLAIFVLWQTAPIARPESEVLPAIGKNAMRGIATALGLAVLCCGYVAWDYWRVSQIYTPPVNRAPAYRDETLQKVQSSWLFSDYVKFAELTTTPLTRENAEHLHTLALEMLHFSPEPKVARMVIESAVLLGRDTEAVYYLQRYKAAFPNEAF